MINAKYRQFPTETSEPKQFIGFIDVYAGDKVIWSESTKIVRLTIKDAIDDAKELKKGYQVTGNRTYN